MCMYPKNQYQQGRTHQQEAEQLLLDVQNSMPRNFDEVAAFCRRMNLPAEVVGKWIWVSFTQKPSKEIIQALRDFGFHWSQRRQSWAHDCGHKSYPSQGNPWDKYEHHWLDSDEQHDRKRDFYRSSDWRRAS